MASFDDTFKEKWTKIVRLFQYTKHLIICAEEFEQEGFKTFLQPSLETRSALDHICRTMSNYYSADGRDLDQEYTIGNLDKALGHLYRAFFDAADWLSVAIREKICILLEPFDNECIAAAIPSYYSQIRPEIDRINFEVAKLRDNKDICRSNPEHETEDIDTYHSIVETLLAHYNTISASIGTLQEYKSKQQKNSAKDAIIKIAIGLAIASIGALIGWLAK